jgi:hypothetical protein
LEAGSVPPSLNFPQLDFVKPSSGFHPVTWERVTLLCACNSPCMCVCAFAYLSMFVSLFVHICIYVCACLSICVYPLLFLFVCSFMYTSLCVYHHCINTLPMVVNVCVFV